MILKPVIYVYPMWHTVSFTLVAKKHLEYLKKLGFKNVYEVDENNLIGLNPHSNPILVLHPFFFLSHRLHQMFEERSKLSKTMSVNDYKSYWISKFEKIVGIDVCDSDSYSDYAIKLLDIATDFVVPSKFCVDVAKRSGIKARIHYLPHGVDPEWYTLPNVWESFPTSKIDTQLVKLFVYKVTKRKKILLFWLWHSAWRKGFDYLVEVYKRVREKRRDVILVLKTKDPFTPEFQKVASYGAVNVYGWLSDIEKMALYDLADVNLNLSLGGGFEINCLEALARGTPCVASGWGSWAEYVPKELQVKTGERVQPLPGNLIHSGYGYAVDVEDTVRKILDILDNYEYYKELVEKWRNEFLSKIYRWDVIADKLARILWG